MTDTDILLKIKLHLNDKKPFAVYSKPGSDSITALFQKDAIQYHLDKFADKGFVFVSFNGNKKVFIPANTSHIYTAKITTHDTGIIKEYKEPTIDKKAKEDFENLVANSVKAIKSGKFDKLVASRTETVAEPNINIVEIYQRLLHTYPNAFRYCFYTPETGLWMGATPEQLLKFSNNTLNTVALAGTQLYKEGEEAVWENKEKEEQQIVTDYIMSSLQEYSDTITTTPPYTFRAGNIIHIKTDITAKLKNSNYLKDVINKLHPTPAVCGMPKMEAMQFLLENEGYNREYYSGYLGELHHDFTTDSDNHTNLFVNLRCMKIVNNKAHLYIGCGITKDSNPEKEFFETVNKSMTMRRVI
ncbi:isochorismate synthase [Flavobacterium salilacus subsp. salilacus]|uniref:isochorismate synthase n=1 Tax=Flavobacterium TaxID=237 RepID=UPI0010751E07|nr:MULTISPECIES: isochorismate synthase [Flavobacterium]KAF2518390.1 isochorismate synthase [Flavobacterium salilacus subsp. salilacus]MBE1615024.1 isochorismate synthase [Flavobacterium sp. SaA2.13]